MARTELDLQTRRHFAQQALELRYAGRQQFPFEAQLLLEARREADAANTLWAVYNRVQENVIQGGILGRGPSGRATRSRKIGAIQEDVRINLELWQLATSLIKG